MSVVEFSPSVHLKQFFSFCLISINLKRLDASSVLINVASRLVAKNMLGETCKGSLHVFQF